MIHGETVQSMLPQDIPWWAPDHAIFFGVLYLVILIIGSGMGVVVFQTLMDTAADARKDQTSHH
ncbi:MAG: hypothetical protein EOM25_06160 [Deltaproteobacteria bacterium]|nr:hypothetical protein [Deltaproteobacteria bacterium]